jgi:hypothetical protein
MLMTTNFFRTLKLVSAQAEAKRKGVIYYFELTDYETAKTRERSMHVQISTHKKFQHQNHIQHFDHLYITYSLKKNPFISA